MKKLAVFFIGLLLFSPAHAQAPTTTKPNVSNLLAQCSTNTPIVGTGTGSSPVCDARGPLGTAAFVNTGTSGATIGLLNAANTWSALQTFNSGVLAATAPAFTGTITGTYTLGGTPSVPTTGLTGALQAAQVPVFTGDMTTTAGSLATTVTKTNGVAFTSLATAAVGQIPATQTNDTACSTCVGLTNSASVAAASAIALTSTTATNITSQSLTAGDYLVWATFYNTVQAPFSAVTTWNYTRGSISLTSATMDFTAGNFLAYPALGATAAADFAVGITPVRYSFAATTTVYLVEQVNYTGGSVGGYGKLMYLKIR